MSRRRMEYSTSSMRRRRTRARADRKVARAGVCRRGNRIPYLPLRRWALPISISVPNAWRPRCPTILSSHRICGRYRRAWQPGWNSPNPFRMPLTKPLCGSSTPHEFQFWPAPTRKYDPVGAVLDIELELMVKAGLTPSEALADATSVPAKVSDRIAEESHPACARICCWCMATRRDIRTTRDIVAIWKQGVRVDRDSVREVIAQRNEAWRFGAGWARGQIRSLRAIRKCG